MVVDFQKGITMCLVNPLNEISFVPRCTMLFNLSLMVVVYPL